MSPIKKILKYFFHHSFSGEMVDRVHQRLAEPGDEREKEEALRDIWNEIGFPEADKRSEMAFARLENTLGVRPPPPSAYPGVGTYRRYLADSFVVVGCFLLSIQGCAGCQETGFYGTVRTFRQAGADHLARW